MLDNKTSDDHSVGFSLVKRGEEVPGGDLEDRGGGDGTICTML